MSNIFQFCIFDNPIKGVNAPPTAENTAYGVKALQAAVVEVVGPIIAKKVPHDYLSGIPGGDNSGEHFPVSLAPVTTCRASY